MDGLANILIACLRYVFASITYRLLLCHLERMVTVCTTNFKVRDLCVVYTHSVPCGSYYNHRYFTMPTIRPFLMKARSALCDVRTEYS